MSTNRGNLLKSFSLLYAIYNKIKKKTCANKPTNMIYNINRDGNAQRARRVRQRGAARAELPRAAAVRAVLAHMQGARRRPAAGGAAAAGTGASQPAADEPRYWGLWGYGFRGCEGISGFPSKRINLSPFRGFEGLGLGSRGVRGVVLRYSDLEY